LENTNTINELKLKNLQDIEAKRQVFNAELEKQIKEHSDLVPDKASIDATKASLLQTDK
jgi:hypothetical protein